MSLDLPPHSAPHVWAVVPTHNRRELTLRTLDALAAQTVPLAGVVLVDNASTDGIGDAVQSSDIAVRVPLRLLTLPENRGSAEGFHAGMADALEQAPDWIWIIDDDSPPVPDCLEVLLASDAAGRDDTAIVAPTPYSAADGTVQSYHRGRLDVKLFRGISGPLPDRCFDGGEHELDYCAFLGTLVRADAVRAAGLPRRELFTQIDDVDFSTRVAQHGRLWLVAQARIDHFDGQPGYQASLGDTVRTHARGSSSVSFLKQAYSLRNMVAWGRETGRIGLVHALSYLVAYLVRALLLERGQRIRRARIFVTMFRDGRRSRFRSVHIADWPGLLTAPSIDAYLDAHAIDFSDELPASEPVVPIA